MPFSAKTKWMTEHPAWPWFVFTLNTVLIAVVVTTIFILVAQQHKLAREITEVDKKLINAVKAGQINIDIVAKKAGVPHHSLNHPELPFVPNGK